MGSTRRYIQDLLALCALLLSGGMGILVWATWLSTVAAPMGSISGDANSKVVKIASVDLAQECLPYFSIVRSLNKSTDHNYLRGVAAIARDDVWAVGYYIDSNGHSQALIEHWDGTEWGVVSLPNIGPNTGGELRAVSAATANDVWAVGSYCCDDNGADLTLIMHWNGTEWAVVPSPNIGQGGSYLAGVAAISANDVWAVGRACCPGSDGLENTLTMHWDGAQWSIIPSPNPGQGHHNRLEGISASAPDNVWAVGYYYTVGGMDYTLVEQWNGDNWSVVPSPTYEGNGARLHGVSVISPTNVWAAGRYGNIETLIEHWDGALWREVPTPRPGQSQGFNRQLVGISAVAPDDIWAVGYYQSSTAPGIRGLIEHWDGSQWRIVTGAQNASGGNYLYAVSALSRGDVWGVGEYDASNLKRRTLVIHHDGECVAACATYFTDVSMSSTFYPYIRCFTCRGVASGYNDGTFQPEEVATRGQVAKIVANASGLSEPARGQSFEDVPPGNTFYLWVQRLASLGYVEGYPCGGPGEPCGTGNLPYFRPYFKATRAQVAKLISNAAGFKEMPSSQSFEDVPSSNPSYVWVERVASRGVIDGYNCGGAGEPCGSGNRKYFRWGSYATRGQVAKMVANSFFPGCYTP